MVLVVVIFYILIKNVIILIGVLKFIFVFFVEEIFLDIFGVCFFVFVRFLVSSYLCWDIFFDVFFLILIVFSVVFLYFVFYCYIYKIYFVNICVRMGVTKDKSFCIL